MNGPTTVASNSTSSLQNALDRIRAVESNYLPDVVVPLSATAWTSNGSLVIPDLGEVAVNDWAREQLSNMLGVRFDRWFQSASPEEQADEMSRRLSRARNKVQLRLAQSPDGPILRAVVSPSYSAIDDSALLATVIDSLDSSNPQLHRLDMTERMTNIVVTIGEPQSRGGIVGAIWGALTITNSGVGWCGLAIVLSIIRLVCRNGMSAPVYEGLLIKVRHRALNIGAVRDLLRTKLQTVPKVLLRATNTLEASTSWPVVNVEAETHELLRERGMIRESFGRRSRGISARTSSIGVRAEPGDHVACPASDTRGLFGTRTACWKLRATKCAVSCDCNMRKTFAPLPVSAAAPATTRQTCAAHGHCAAICENGITPSKWVPSRDMGEVF